MAAIWSPPQCVKSVITKRVQWGAYILGRTGSSLAQVMVCRLFGTKQLPEPIMIYWQTYPNEYISTKIYLKLKKIQSNIHLKMSSENGDQLVSKSLLAKEIWLEEKSASVVCMVKLSVRFQNSCRHIDDQLLVSVHGYRHLKGWSLRYPNCSRHQSDIGSWSVPIFVYTHQAASWKLMCDVWRLHFFIFSLNWGAKNV